MAGNDGLLILVVLVTCATNFAVLIGGLAIVEESSLGSPFRKTYESRKDRGTYPEQAELEGIISPSLSVGELLGVASCDFGEPSYLGLVFVLDLVGQIDARVRALHSKSANPIGIILHNLSSRVRARLEFDVQNVAGWMVSCVGHKASALGESDMPLVVVYEE